jgi:4-aminobutyrate aminotransferase-like enzyme
MACLEQGLSGLDEVAAVIVEPIQGRGGIVVPPKGWLSSLSEECRERGILLILDEIYTGFGRSGAWFACEHEGVIPDLICVGKALGGGFPISAVIGKSEVMEKWGLSGGESIHTSTFLGNPLGCRMALESLKILEDEALVERALALEKIISNGLLGLSRRHNSIGDVRGKGAMFGVDLVVSRSTREPDPGMALAVTRKLLERGFLVLPSGVEGNVISVIPPFVITEEQLEAFFVAFDQVLGGLGAEA